MIELFLGIGVATFIVFTAFQISYLLSMKRTSEGMREFLRNTEGNLNATLAELKGTLENVRKISGDVGAVTDDVRRISHTVANLEKGMRESLIYMKDRLGSAAEANIAGLKAGITTGVATLMRNLQEGRRDEHERGTGEE